MFFENFLWLLPSNLLIEIARLALSAFLAAIAVPLPLSEATLKNGH